MATGDFLSKKCNPQVITFHLIIDLDSSREPQIAFDNPQNHLELSAYLTCFHSFIFYVWIFISVKAGQWMGNSILKSSHSFLV